MADLKDGGASYLPPDLLKDTSTPDTDKNYFKITITDLELNTEYPLQFAWVYEDKTISDYSATYNVVTASETTLNAPSIPTLYWGNGLLSVEWNGKDYTDANPLLNYKQVNIWIRGGNFGNTSVKTGDFFTSSGIKNIPLGPGTYYIKLQAESALGNLSAFSGEASTVSYKPPFAVTSLTGKWTKDDNTTKTDTLRVNFTWDPNAVDSSTNSNAYATYFKIILTSGLISRVFYSPVNKSSSSQVFYLDSQANKANFGLFTKSFTMSVQVIDPFGNVSSITTNTSDTYVTPLNPPVITVTKGTLLYIVYYTSPAAGDPFDTIVIEEDLGAGYVVSGSGIENPKIVYTSNTTTRSVRAKFIDSNGDSTAYSNIITNITPDPAVSADTTGPDNVLSVTTSGGIDALGTLGFNGFINVSWPAVTGGGIRGYRIQFRPVSTPAANYSYLDSPGTGTSYRISGLAVGSIASPVVYEVAVATYDEFNNTSSSYISGSDVSIGGTPAISDYITAGNFQFGQGVDPSNLSLTGTGMKRGLFFDSSNYWFLNASNSARLKVGGTTTNYLLWDGAEFVIDGDLRARKGNFSGNVQIASGGSLYSQTTPPTSYSITAVTFTATTATYTTNPQHNFIAGNSVVIFGISPVGYSGVFVVTSVTPTTFTVNNTTNLTVTTATGSVMKATGLGFILNKDGLTFNSSAGVGITTIDAATGYFTTSSAKIGGWDITASTIAKGGITLDSTTPSIIATKNAYYVGIVPQVSLPTDVVLWAGQNTYATRASSNFRVEASGVLRASGAFISGEVVITGGSTLSTINTASQNANDAISGLANKLQISSDTIVNASKQITAINSNGIQIYSGGYNPSTNTYSGTAAIVINSAGITAGTVSGSTLTPTFSISASTGSAYFKGEINAGTGNIAGWTIDANSIYKGSTYISSTGTNGFISIGSGSPNYVKISSDGIQAGHTTFSSAPFRVDTTGKVIANSFELNSGNDYLRSDGTFRLGNGIMTYNGTLFEMNPQQLSNANFKIRLNVTSNEDGTFGDSTVVQDADTKELTIGRAFFYGATNAPGTTTSRPLAQGGTAFNIGDIWLQRE